jgi:RNA polymerase sigma-70 factor (ECF subfamily)
MGENSERVDAATLEQAQRGSRAAREILLREMQDVWFRFCLGMLRDAELARDATQETALRFLRQLEGFRGESQLRTWSLSIAVNVVREMRRKRGATGSGDDIDLDQLQLAPERSSGDSADPLEHQEAKDQLRATLQDLPERQREVVTLRFFEELSTEETATAMGCAVGTVKATLHQALRALRTKMTQASE